MNGQNNLEINDDIYNWGIHTQLFLMIGAARFGLNGPCKLNTIEKYNLEAYSNIAENIKMCGWFSQEDGSYKRINTHQYTTLCETLIDVNKELERRKYNRNTVMLLLMLVVSVIFTFGIISLTQM